MSDAGGAGDGLGLRRIWNDGIALGVLDLGFLPVRLGSAIGLRSRSGGGNFGSSRSGITVAARDWLLDLLLVFDHLVEGRSFGIGLIRDRRRGRVLEGPLGGVCWLR